ncbi:M23 family metallopeptidase [Chryseolinea lacunae]|uniref:Peptidoglycan DD-metalloendopeptidase family protein n=1 Tax=Chryseolinea lacunae TaxID=2801331 RepID=A0ABS1KR79_9BACT|nr:peptidoglycan DD-metalloendopeptidase family protein [Chryseolinea lacunae]MBL0741946.1 peptidoglycan DD-metalloendopeptidase family protein [Chryseolinea lacunae]
MQKRWLGFILVAVLTVAVVLTNRYYLPTLMQTEASLDTAKVVVAKAPSVLYGMVVDNYTVIEDKIKRNERLGDILTAYNVPASIIHQISQLSRNVFDVRKIAPNKKYTLLCNQTDSLKTAKVLVYEPNSIDYIVFRFEDTLWVDVCKRDVVILEKSIAGEIRSNLSETIEELGISHELTNKFVDIFGWQVDFQRLQKGDKFKLIYEEAQVEGVSVGIKQINGIYFEHFGHPYYAVPFDQGEGIDYFDDEGKSTRKALLKYPIEFTRISSRYTMSRFHPVQKRWKAHLGTDFAAPVGTPIRTVGDGVVEEAQYKSNNGNYVKVRHNGTYTTQYLHMSRIADGIRAGMHIRQGQTIGYVGSTGLATGPHLCYRFWRNGVQVDALRVELPPSEPVKKDHEAEFNALKEKLVRKLEAIPFPEQKQDPIASL